MVKLVTGLRRRMGRIRQQHKSRRLGNLFRERIIDNQRVVPTLSLRDVIFSLKNLIRLAFPDPRYLLESQRLQLLDNV